LNKGTMKAYMINTLLIIALCAAYSLLGGLLQLVLGLLISALMGVTFYRQHYGFGILNSLLIIMIFSLFGGVLFAISAAAPLILLGIALALGTRFKLSLGRLLFLCAFLFVANIVASFMLAGSQSGGEVTLSASMLEMGRMLKEAFKAQYSDPELATVIDRAVTEAVNMSIMLSPSIFMIISVALAYLLITMYKKLQIKNDVDMAFLTPFEMLRADRLMAVLYLVLLFVFSAAPAGLFADMAINVIVLLSFLFMAVGMSVFDMKMKRSGIKQSVRRLLFAALLLFSGMLFMMPVIFFAVTGLSDSFFDYRRLSGEKEEKEEI